MLEPHSSATHQRTQATCWSLAPSSVRGSMGGDLNIDSGRRQSLLQRERERSACGLRRRLLHGVQCAASSFMGPTVQKPTFFPLGFSSFASESEIRTCHRVISDNSPPTRITE